MESIRIEIINPKAKKILKNLAELDLIKMKEEDKMTQFKNLLGKLRSNRKYSPASTDITSEVEKERNNRYDRQVSGC